VRIAVISDTHDRVPAGLADRLAIADEVWHLGDVCMPSVLAHLEARCPLLRVVMGNCDSDFSWPLTLELEREGAKFYLVHIPPAKSPDGVDFVLHGHTHVPRDDTIRGERWLNPGCISRANRGAPASFGWLTHDGKEWSWRIEWL
jgi:putative phosphoesterase